MPLCHGAISLQAYPCHVPKFQFFWLLVLSIYPDPSSSAAANRERVWRPFSWALAPSWQITLQQHGICFSALRIWGMVGLQENTHYAVSPSLCSGFKLAHFFSHETRGWPFSNFQESGSTEGLGGFSVRILYSRRAEKVCVQHLAIHS